MARLAALAVLAVGALLVLGSRPAGAPSLDRPASRADRLGVRGPAPGPTGVIVRFEREADRAELRDRAGVSVDRSLPLPQTQLVRPARGQGVPAAVAALNRLPGVRYAEPDVVRRAFATPDDPLFNQLWGLHNLGQPVAGRTGTVDADIDAAETWDLGTGSAGITVAVIDSGVELTHPDLAPNLWSNPGETANGADDDGNGLVDDIRGWDFADGDADPTDLNGHGTHVAGTVGARGNDGRGVTGVAWRTSLLPLRVLGADGSGTLSELLGAYAYVKAKNVRIVNASLGGTDASRAERDAIAAAADTLFVAAAGNDGADNDTTGSYPCNYDLPNVVCVGATDQDDRLASFSNRGARTVDLAAPGTNVVSTYLGGAYALLDGTSMAAPHVAGVAALVWARDPAASVARVRSALLGTTRPAPTLAGATVTGGVVNALEAVRSIPAPEAAPEPAAPTAPLTTAPAPAPAPDPGRGTTASDETPPTLIVSARSRIARRTLARRGLRLTVRCSEACTLRGELRVRGRVIGISRGGRAAEGTATMTLRLRRGEARRLRRPVRAELRVRGADPSGNAVLVRRRTALR